MPSIASALSDTSIRNQLTTRVVTTAPFTPETTVAPFYRVGSLLASGVPLD
jgi:hypothetical protein